MVALQAECDVRRVAPAGLFVGSLAVTVKLPQEEDCWTITKHGMSASTALSPRTCR